MIKLIGMTLALATAVACGGPCSDICAYAIEECRLEEEFGIFQSSKRCKAECASREFFTPEEVDDLQICVTGMSCEELEEDAYACLPGTNEEEELGDDEEN